MGLWARIFAATYEQGSGRAERTGLGEARATLLRGVEGRVLEIGAGTGWNVVRYPPGSNVTYTEPDAHMGKRLRAKGVEVVTAGAEALPFVDDSFDTVVSTLVLCTVPDVPAALGEIRRVLAPGGKLLFLEHVRADPGTKLERWQDRLHGPWHALARGCHCNRDTLSLLAAEGFSVEDVRHEAWRFMPPIVRPVVIGSAR